MPGPQDQNAQNLNSWLALASGLGDIARTGYGNLKSDLGFYGNAVASMPSPAQNVRAMFSTGYTPNGYVPTSPVKYAADGAVMSEPIPKDRLAQMGDQPSQDFFVGRPGWQIPMAARPEDDYLGTQYILGSIPTGGRDQSPDLPPLASSLQGGKGGLAGTDHSLGGSVPAMDLSAYNDILRQLREKGGELSKKQQQQVDALRSNLAASLDVPVQYDLSPLAALVDSQTGSHLAQGYARPQSPEEKRREIAQAEQGISAADAGITQQQMAQLQAAASGQLDLAKLKGDQSYKNAMLGLEGQKVDLEKQKVGLEALKAGKGAEPKDSQYQAALYGKRMSDANAIMDKLYSNPAVLRYETGNMGAVDRHLPTSMQEGPTKELAQAEKNFVNAVLRRESGSAISPEEFKSAEAQYFPRTGDDQQTLAQKSQNRERAIEGLRLASGPAWSQFSGTAGTPSLGGTGTDITPEMARAELLRRRSK